MLNFKREYMSDANEIESYQWLNCYDIEAVPDIDDKLKECEFFFEMLAAETDRSKFRWLLSAFLNAAYSFFESSALTAHFSHTGQDDELHVDQVSLCVLRHHINVKQTQTNPKYVKTSGLTPLTKQIYYYRNKSTHHFSLSIMAAGLCLPEDYYLGHMKGEGIQVMPFCRDALQLIRDVYAEIN